MEKGCPLKLIIILGDGIRGHLNQSRGVAKWLARATGAEILEAEVPLLKGFAKFRARAGVGRLANGNRRDARDWLASFGDALLRKVGQWFAARGLREGADDVLIISAGNAPAPYNLALSCIWRCSCAVVMTPGSTGTDPFDFAIVPEHDYPEQRDNIFVTLGSPNLIDKEEVKKEGQKFLLEYPADRLKKWSVLLGGDDANYLISAEWVKREVGKILLAAEKEDAAVYITTSRRTAPAAEEALAGRSPGVKYVLYASRDTFNPIPALLGFSDVVFCTDDSVNMVSETVTGGHSVVLMRASRRKGVKRVMQKMTAALVERRGLPRNLIWGVPRFDAFYDSLARRGVLVEFGDWIEGRREPLSLTRCEERDSSGFNEAKRAAGWICDNWRKI